MKVFGIDPGKTGGVAMLSPSYVGKGMEVDLLVMPELSALVAKIEWAAGEDDVHVFIEKAQSFPGQGIASAFNYGVHFGELLGAVTALQVRHTLIGPRSWTRVMHLGTKDGPPKKRSLEAVARLFPNIKLEATPRSKKPHDGLVDALLIAEFGRRHLEGKTIDVKM